MLTEMDPTGIFILLSATWIQFSLAKFILTILHVTIMDNS